MCAVETGLKIAKNMIQKFCKNFTSYKKAGSGTEIWCQLLNGRRNLAVSAHAWCRSGQTDKTHT